MSLKSFILPLALFICLLYSCKTKDKIKVQSPVQVSQEQILKDSINKYPDSLALWESLIELYSDSGDYKKAIEVTGLALAKDSGNVELWDTKARLYYEDGDTLSAITAYEQALKIFPMPDYMVSLGSLYAQTKNPKALLMSEALMKTTDVKMHVEAYFIQGLYYEFLGEKVKAMSFFDKCIQLDYTYMYAYREKAICYYDMGKYKEALDILTKAITVENSFDEGYYWMGKVLEKLNRKEEAIQNYQLALMYDKDFSEAQEALKRLQGK
jgi:tetratricopeptide (TPR) repeat protein